MKPSTHTLLAAILLCAATVGYTYHMPEFLRFFAGQNDFLPRYTHGRLVGSADVYGIETGYREQERATGVHIVGAYHDRFPWQALVFSSFSWLPYTAAYWLWITMNLACFAIVVRYWLLPRDCVLWGVVFFPVAASLIVAQDSLMLAACMVGVLRLAERGKDVPAGLLLALCTAKPHLFLLLPLALVFRRRWKLFASAAGGTAALLAISTVVAGRGWLSQMLGVAGLLARDLGGDVQRRPTVFQFGVNPATLAAAAVLAALVAAVIWRTRDFPAAVGIAMIGSILLAPHTSVYDLPLLLVALPALPLGVYGNWLRILLWTPLPYWALLRDRPWSTVLPLLLVAVIGLAWWRQREVTANGPCTPTN